MVRYRNERERLPAPGTEYNIGNGIHRFRKKNDPDLANVLGLMPHVSSRAPALVPSSKKLSNGSQKQDPLQALTIDPIAYAVQITPKVLRELNDLPNLYQLDVSIDLDSKIFEKLKKDNWSSVRYQIYFIERYCTSEEQKKHAYEQIFYSGLEFLKQGNYTLAHGIFQGLVNAYLNNKEGIFSDKIGLICIDIARKIARAWVLASASDYVNLSLNLFEQFKAPNTLITPPHSAIETLERTGEIRDLPLLQIIGKKCAEGGLEIVCSNAARRIKIRDILRLSVKAMHEDKKSDGKDGLQKLSQAHIPSSDLSDEQLVYHLSFLFDELGLGVLISKLPIFEQFGNVIYNPVIDRITQNHAILNLSKLGLDQDMPFSINNSDCDGTKSSKNFCLEHRLIQEAEQNKFILSEKGKNLVRMIMQIAVQTKIEIEI
ncbi:MAG: hypothetical protein AABX38_07875 [Candidatus Micrarchaeota archaeon]